MDVSAFEEDTGDVDASAVPQRMTEHLSPTLAAAVAIVAHIVRLAILVLALFACVVLYCFTVSWLVHLWLQTSLLAFTAELLRSCIGDEAAITGASLHAQRRVPLPSEQWLEEPEPEPLLDSAEAGGSSIEESAKVGMVGKAAATLERHGGTHDKSVEHVPDASGPPANSREPEPIHRQEPSSSIAEAQKLRVSTLHTSNTAALCGGAVQKALVSDKKKFVAKENAVPQKILPGPRPVLTDQEKKAAAQTSFIENMKAGMLNRAFQPSVEVSRSLATNEATAARNNAFNFTAEQLAEASSFMSTASRDYKSKASTGRGGPRSAKPHVSDIRRFQPNRHVAQPPKPVPAGMASVSNPPDYVPPHVRKSLQAKACRAAPQDLLQVTNDGKPVDMTQKPENSDGDDASGCGASSIPEEADNMVTDEHNEIHYEVDEERKAGLISEINESTVNEPADTFNPNQETATVFHQPFIEPEHEAVFSRKQPSHPERLSFYDSTPELIQPASRAMTATALKAFQTTSSRAVDDRIDNARSIIEGLGPEKTSPMLSTTSYECPTRENGQELPRPTISISRPSEEDFLAQDLGSDVVEAEGWTGSDQSGKEHHADMDVLWASDLEAALLASCSDNSRPQPLSSIRDENAMQEQTSMQSRDDAVRRAVKVIQEQADVNMIAEKEPPGITLSPQYPPVELRPDEISTSDVTRDLIDLDLGGGALTDSVPGESFSATPLRPSIDAPNSSTPSFPSALESTEQESIGHERSVDASDILEPPEPHAQKDPPLLPSTSSAIGFTAPTKPPGLQNARLVNLDAFDDLLSKGFASQLEVIEDDGDQASLSAGGPVQDIEDHVPANIATNGSIGVLDGSKRRARERRRLARDKLKEAWLEREEARTRVVGTWSLGGMQQLEDATRLYHEARSALATLMPSGHLNEEDFQSFPAFTTSALAAPKVRPSGMQEIKSRRKANESNTSSSHEKDSESSSELDGLKDNMMAARKLREDAIAFQRSRRPNTNIAFHTWKDTAGGKLKRANLYYNSKRQALAAAFPNGALPAELEAQFPEIP
ncbi:uncharacterized protein MYCFIDRAFT_76008 [Pseudocercospora fijiensis CIRAD86]|uniref:Uncharacterized protein n=1 Tax=Pseudocercospora fijiensis (strain CIRAD86) TaxID=383855 RepID=N1QAY8_PSEFD|nr:uncharacterized protein MYCFIDRAFT_76008 [Pseudocercospora fijiensis CIRAD86]EME88178.1 hypothetical protein MYCFIDRAFT_76008 [Pseudocercospora fijiensis CIRAD86]